MKIGEILATKYGKADFKLTNGEYKILQADDDKMTRGTCYQEQQRREVTTATTGTKIPANPWR